MQARDTVRENVRRSAYFGRCRCLREPGRGADLGLGRCSVLTRSVAKGSSFRDDLFGDVPRESMGPVMRIFCLILAFRGGGERPRDP